MLLGLGWNAAEMNRLILLKTAAIWLYLRAIFSPPDFSWTSYYLEWNDITWTSLFGNVLAIISLPFDWECWKLAPACFQTVRAWWMRSCINERVCTCCCGRSDWGFRGQGVVYSYYRRISQAIFWSGWSRSIHVCKPLEHWWEQAWRNSYGLIHSSFLLDFFIPCNRLNHVASARVSRMCGRWRLLASILWESKLQF